MAVKQMPQNKEAEMSILGVCFLNKSALEKIAEEVNESMFYNEANKKIFKALDGYGLSRVDFFLKENTNEVIFNEINTLPGFTGISMYPMLWEAKGMKKADLIENLIELALERTVQ